MNKRATLVGDSDYRGGCACVEAGGIWNTSVPSLFCCEPKTILKIKKITIMPGIKLEGEKKCYSPKFPNLNNGGEGEKCEIDSN